MRIAIIGTAGRKEDGAKMSRALFTEMAKEALKIITDKCCRHSDAILVSGGAAWADHVAVRIFRTVEVRALELHLPAEWNAQRKCFVENNARMDPGRIANYYHNLMAEKCCSSMDSLAEIHHALSYSNCTHTISNGFRERNRLVGAVDAMIAFTWGSGDVPKNGGTSHTWRNSGCTPSKKYHVPLHTLGGRT